MRVLRIARVRKSYASMKSADRRCVSRCATPVSMLEASMVVSTTERARSASSIVSVPRLLQRTTRKLGLTDAGRTYYDYCARIVNEIEEAERAVSTLQS